MYKKKREQQFAFFLCVLFAHALFLSLLFFSYITQPLLQHKPMHFMNFKVPAPVIFYGTHMTPRSKPGTNVTKSVKIKENKVTTHKSIDKKNTSTTQSQSVKAHDGLARRVYSNKNDNNSSTHDTALTQKEVLKKNENITLSDIFSHARSTFVAQKQLMHAQEGDGAGYPLIIKEGDIRYYNLWKTFLEHLNNHARFNRARKPQQVTQWLQAKKIKNNLQCAITIDNQGVVLGVEIMLSSGHQPFDALCLDDIYSASPFPPLPDHLNKQKACFEVKSYF